MDQLIVISDLRVDYPQNPGAVYTWNGYAENDKASSLLRFIDNSADELRAKYLTFIETLGQGKNQHPSLSNLFQLNEGPSLWWMSLLVEKSPYKSPRIIDCIRLLALEKILEIHQPTEVIFALDDWCLAYSIKKLCQRRSINFKWDRQSSFFGANTSEIFRATTFLSKGKALAYLLYYFSSRWAFRSPTLKKKVSSKRSIFFASYFFNLDLGFAGKKSYYSRQWGDLPGLLQDNGWKTSHLEFFIKSPDIPTPKKAKKIMSSLVANADIRSHHFTDQYLSFQMFFKVIGEFFRLQKKLREVANTKVYFNVPNSKVNLWYLLKEDWHCSFSGKTAVQNLILIELISRHMRDLPFQKMGFYLCENMGWERALIHAWKHNSHGTLVAVPHSTIRFWDLRYFSLPRLDTQVEKSGLPLPDIYAVNGEMARKALLVSGVPKEMLRNVEALRYAFLERYINNSSKTNGGETSQGRTLTKVLVLGDFTERQTHLMLTMLESVVMRFGIEADFWLKPHPVCGIAISEYPGLEGRQTAQPLHEIIGDYDLIFGSNVTTASLDCFLMGGKTIVFLDDSDLNNSPLRGIPGVQFVSNADELYRALTETSGDVENRVVSDFFWIDSSMPRWADMVHEFTGKGLDFDDNHLA